MKDREIEFVDALPPVRQGRGRPNTWHPILDKLVQSDVRRAVKSHPGTFECVIRKRDDGRTFLYVRCIDPGNPT